MGRLRLAAGKFGLPIALLTVAVENRTDGRPEDLEERLSIARGELGPELHVRFLRENALDYDLYEWASVQQVPQRFAPTRRQRLPNVGQWHDQRYPAARRHSEDGFRTATTDRGL
jgi:hypothetical protein